MFPPTKPRGAAAQRAVRQFGLSTALGAGSRGVGLAPSITSADTADVNTGDTAVITITATGSSPLVFSIVSNPYASLFQIDASTGDLSFVAASVAGDYPVIVRATNPWGRGDQTITVRVASPLTLAADLLKLGTDQLVLGA